MILKRTLSISIAVLALGTIALGVPACTGGGDDDDVASPTPTPANPDICILEWQGDGGDSTINVYRLIMTAAEWGSASNVYDKGQTSLNIAAYRIPSGAGSLFDGEVVTSTTSGTFSTAGTAGVQEGDTVSFEDTDAQSYHHFSIDASDNFVWGTSAGMAGVGDFAGEWSSFGLEDAPVVGTGAITMVGSNGAAVTVDGAVFGYCDSSTAFAPGSDWRFDFPLKRR